MSRYLLGLLFLVVTALATPQVSTRSETVSAPLGNVTIVDFKGEVRAAPPGQSPINVTRGLVLPADSLIETAKGRVLLGMQDGSQVLVNSNTRVVIKAPAETGGHWFDLLIGKIRAQVQKHLGENPPFRLGTPTAVITVRGTDFTVTVDKKTKTSVYVYEGVVEFVSVRAMDRPVLIKPGFYSSVAPDHSVEQPEPIHGNFGNRGAGDDSGDRINKGNTEDRKRNSGESDTPARPDSSSPQERQNEHPD